MRVLLEAVNAELFYSIRLGKGKYFWRRRRLLVVAFYEANFDRLPDRFKASYMTLGRTFIGSIPELNSRLFLKRNRAYRQKVP